MQNENYSLFIVVMLIAPLQFINADNKFSIKELLDLHNHHRKLHGSGALKLDLLLSIIAMEAALDEANSTPPKIGDYGINTYWIKHDDSSSTDEATAETVFNYWYSEGEHYSYTKEPLNKDKIKHFTQIVWKDTKQIGIAIARVPQNLKTAIVALYSPRGNIPSKYISNVLKPRDA